MSKWWMWQVMEVKSDAVNNNIAFLGNLECEVHESG